MSAQTTSTPTVTLLWVSRSGAPTTHPTPWLLGSGDDPMILTLEQMLIGPPPELRYSAAGTGARKGCDSREGEMSMGHLGGRRTWQPGLSTLTASLVVALGSSGAVAAQASAQSIQVTQGCVVNTAADAGTVNVTGLGFTAGDSIDLVSSPAGASGTAMVGPAGTFATSFNGPTLPTLKPAAKQFTLTGTDQQTGATAATTFQVANLAVATNPAQAKPSTTVTYSFSGFRPGAEIYAHYLHRNKVTATARFGRSKGACGQLMSRAKFYPGRQRFTTYKVQFDDSSKYSPHSSPVFVATLRLFRF